MDEANNNIIEENTEKIDHSKENIVEIVFTGKDFSPIDESYISWFYEKENKRESIGPYSLSDSSDDDDFSRELKHGFRELLKRVLNSYQNIVNNVSDEIIIAYTEEFKDGKKRNKPELKFYFEDDIGYRDSKQIQSETVETKTEEDPSNVISNDKDILSMSNHCRFGNVVGFVRKEYDAAVLKSQSELPFDEDKFWGLPKPEIWNDSFRDYLWKTNKRSIKAKITIEIRSRFDDTKTNNAYFLAALLYGGNIKLAENYSVSFNYENIFDFYMLSVLKRQLKDALIKGYYKKYQCFESNSDRVRGTIDIPRHIRLNANLNNGKIACSYRENTADNTVNHLILKALDILKTKHVDIYNSLFDNELKFQIRNMKYEIGYPKYDDHTLLTKNMVPVSHPFYTEYRMLQKYCIMILKNLGLSPFKNDKEAIQGILYYIPDLWEKYLERHIKKSIRYSKEELSVKTQREINIVSRIEDDNSEGITTSRPDFVFENKDSKPFFILDAKYIEKWNSVLIGKEAIDPKTKSWALAADYNKCLRDMVSFDSHSAGVIFPIKEAEYNTIIKPRWEHRISDYYQSGTFYSIPVKIPLPNEKEQYKDWELRLNKYVRDSLQGFVGRLEYELQVSDLINSSFAKVMEEIRKIDRPKLPSNEYVEKQHTDKEAIEGKY